MRLDKKIDTEVIGAAPVFARTKKKPPIQTVKELCELPRQDHGRTRYIIRGEIVFNSVDNNEQTEPKSNDQSKHPTKGNGGLDICIPNNQ